MLITTKALSATDLLNEIRAVSEDDYCGNLIAEVKHVRGNQFRVKIGTLDSRKHGSRTTATGRHGRYACWHAFRDVFRAIFESDPDATIRTSLAVYRGYDGFEREYPTTAYTDVGSMMCPAYMDDLCVTDGCS